MASISIVRICNMALSNIGAKSTIESLTEGSAESNECNLWYDWSRLQALEAFDWSFARRRLTLATHGDDPPGDEWGFRYQYPADCVKFRRIWNPAGLKALPVPYEIAMSENLGTKTILTDMDDAIGIFTFDQEIVTMFSPLFVDMMAALMASRLAMPLTGKKSIQDDMIQRFTNLQGAAPASNANEESQKPPQDADWIEAR